MYDVFHIEELKSNINTMYEQLGNLYHSLNIENLESEHSKLYSLISKNNFYDDLEKAQDTLKKVKQLEDVIQRYGNLKLELDDLKTLVDLAIEENDESFFPEIQTTVQNLQKEFNEALIASLLKDEYDKNDSILTLHAGAGGTESQDWVEMLLRMYTRWAERHSYKTQILDMLMGDEAGIKSVSILIEGSNAYGYTKSEKGIHRLVRISPFDAAKRRHTSFASVDVMPKLDDEISVDINPEDLKIDTFRASGAGGQHINKTESAIRITHVPTGLVVSCQTQRSQHQNRDFAMTMLKAKLFELERSKQKERISELKGEQKEVAWGNQIRSYVFCPYTLVKDHRTGFEFGNVEAVMDGEIDGFINAYLKQNSR